MKNVIKIIFFILVLSSFSYSQFAEEAIRYSSNGMGIGTRALGMGNAYIGVSDDYSAVFWNPAGLAQLRRLEFTAGISSFGLTNDATYNTKKSSDNVTATALDDIGFVFPFPTIRGSLVFAFGYNRIADFASVLKYQAYNYQSSIIPSLYDADVDYDIPFNTYLTNPYGYTTIQGNVNQQGLVKEKGNLGQWSFSGAIDVEENISFGITLNVISGTYGYTRNFVEEDLLNMYSNIIPDLPKDSAYLRFNKFYHDRFIASEITGGEITFGAMYRADLFRVGLIAKAPSSVTIKETYHDEGQSVFDATGGWLNNDAPATTWSTRETHNEYGVKSPWTLGVGGSVYPLPELLLAADLEYVDWTQVEWTDNSTLEKDNPSLQSLFRATTSYRIGAEFDIPQTDVRVRGGYSLTPSPYKGDPSSYDQVLYTAGAGIFLQRNVVIDGAIGFGSYKTFHNQYSSSIPSSSRTDESISTTSVNITLSYRF